jgi:hypothetical protein
MKLVSSITRAAREPARIFARGGPVGLYHILKLAVIRRRLARVSVLIHREHELHRDHMRALSFELKALVSKQMEANVEAAQFWKVCGTSEVKS